MNVYVGIDVSLRSVAICILDGSGTILKEVDLPCEVDEIAGYLQGSDHTVERIGFEAGSMSQMLFHGLKSLRLCQRCVTRRTGLTHAALRTFFEQAGTRRCT